MSFVKKGFDKKYIVVVDDPQKALLELANIVNRLRFHTKYWEEHYGSFAKRDKKDAERKADEWLLKHTKQVDE